VSLWAGHTSPGMIFPTSWSIRGSSIGSCLTAITALARTATAAETALGVVLLLQASPRLIAALSGMLLLTFALTMTLALGMKARLDASVFSASAGALIGAVCRLSQIEEQYEEELI
jgi:hypothetical protein